MGCGIIKYTVPGTPLLSPEFQNPRQDGYARFRIGLLPSSRVTSNRSTGLGMQQQHNILAKEFDVSNDHVWMTDFLSDGRTTVGFKDDLRERDMTRGIEFGTTAGRGLPWPADEFPKTMWAKADDGWSDKRLARERHVITGPSVPLVSAEVVAALSGIDISPSKFVPTDVFFSDRQRRTEKSYFQFHITPELKTVDLEKSHKLIPLSPERYSAAGARNDDLAVSREACGDLRMWMGGEMVMNHFFSDEVVQALKKAKLAQLFRLTRCRLV